MGATGARHAPPSQGHGNVRISTLSRPSGRIDGCDWAPPAPVDTRAALLRLLSVPVETDVAMALAIEHIKPTPLLPRRERGHAIGVGMPWARSLIRELSSAKPIRTRSQ